jgi:hypothetical protein
MQLQNMWGDGKRGHLSSLSFGSVSNFGDEELKLPLEIEAQISKFFLPTTSPLD